MAEKSSDLENVNSFPENDSTDYTLTRAETDDLATAARDAAIADDDDDDDIAAETVSATSSDDDDDDDDVHTTSDTEEIRSQIEETRAQMGETIDAIQEKLSFSNISEQVSDQINSAVETAKDAVYDATLGKAGTFMKNLGNELSNTTVVQTARDNPLPFVLIGLGVGLLAYNGFSSGKRRGNGSSYGYSSQGSSSGRSTFRSATDTVTGAASSAAGTVGDAASSAYGTVTGAASNAAGKVSDVATSAYGKVTDVAGSAYEGIGNYAGTAREKVGELGTQAREQYDYYIEENPLAVGAVALAIGAAVGFSIPSTQYEGEWMGEARQNLLDKAQEQASTLVDKVKQVAGEAQKTIGDEVKAQGLLGDADSTASGSGTGFSASSASAGTPGMQSPGLGPKNS